MRAPATMMAAVLVPLLLAGQTKPDGSDDVILRAMADEMDRARTLSIASLEDPYYVEYTLDDGWSYTVSAALGALIGAGENRFRLPRVKVRVGDYKFDNTNYILSEYYSGSRYDPDQFVIDNDYQVLRRALWLATDRAFKTAVEAIARKRAALKNVTQTEVLPDFWKAAPAQRIEAYGTKSGGLERWADRVRTLSQVFHEFPEIVSSTVTFNATRSTYYMRNSEGTVIRRPEPLAHYQVQAFGQAPDGASIRAGLSVPRPDDRSIPAEAELRKLTGELAGHIRALLKAPKGEGYVGPVLFEGIAGPQIFAEVLAPNLVLGRRPIGEPGRPVPFLASELEGRLESRVLPEFLDVTDDPTQASWQGAPLLGHYTIDEEGVVPKAVTLIEKGRLKTFLLTRQPVKGFEASNGRARMPGALGARAASVTNLFVRSSETLAAPELKKKLIELVQTRNKPYGMIIRRMDFPSAASSEDVRRLMMAAGQSGSVRPVSAPLLAYRIYPDGREELVRGLRFRGLTVRSLRDIMAVSDDLSVLHYLNNLAPLAMLSGGSYVAPVSVVAPSLLFDELELEKPQDDTPHLPLVPAPPLTAQARLEP